MPFVAKLRNKVQASRIGEAQQEKIEADVFRWGIARKYNALVGDGLVETAENLVDELIVKAIAEQRKIRYGK